jgi:hypothetical protein
LAVLAIVSMISWSSSVVSERLLDKDGLSGLQGPADEVGVGVVARDDEYRVQGGIAQYSVSRGRGCGETEPPLRVDCGQRAGGRDVFELYGS